VRRDVIHFSHDPEPEIAFSALKNLLAALRDAGARGLDLDDIAKEPIRVPLDQTIQELAAEGTDDATCLLNIYLPITSSLQRETKDRLAHHNDFFVREAVAAFLARIRSAQDAMIAEQLADDKHAQVARAGKIAVAAIKRSNG
jgi:hypothetical protein